MMSNPDAAKKEELINAKKAEFSNLKKDIQVHKDLLREDPQNDKFTGVAFISFNYMAQSENLIKDYNLDTWRWLTNGCKHKECEYKDKTKFHIFKAPGAGEVIWKNLKVSEKEQLKKKIITILITAGIMLLVFSILAGLKVAATYLKKQIKGSGDTVTQFFSISMFGALKIANKIFDKVIGGQAERELPYTTVRLYASAVKKTVLAQWINSCFLICVLHYILNSSSRWYIWGSGGWLTDLTMICIFNSGILPLLYILNFGLFTKMCQRKKLLKDPNQTNYTQKQAHTIMEGVPMDAVRSYTDIYQVLLTSHFFIAPFPLNTVFHMFSLMAMYWIQKYYLIRHCSKPKELGPAICFESVMLMKLAPLSMALGQLYLDIILRDSVSITYIIQVIIMAALVAIPIEDSFLGIYQSGIDEAEAKKHLSYDDCRQNFDIDYARSNPVTSEEALKAHLRFVKAKREAPPAPPKKAGDFDHRKEMYDYRSNVRHMSKKASNALKNQIKVMLHEEPKTQIPKQGGEKSTHQIKVKFQDEKNTDWLIGSDEKLTEKAREEEAKSNKLVREETTNGAIAVKVKENSQNLKVAQELPMNSISPRPNPIPSKVPTMKKPIGKSNPKKAENSSNRNM